MYYEPPYIKSTPIDYQYTCYNIILINPTNLLESKHSQYSIIGESTVA